MTNRDTYFNKHPSLITRCWPFSLFGLIICLAYLLITAGEKHNIERQAKYVASLPIIETLSTVDGCTAKKVTGLGENGNVHVFYIARCGDTITTTQLRTKATPLVAITK